MNIGIFAQITLTQYMAMMQIFQKSLLNLMQNAH